MGAFKGKIHWFDQNKKYGYVVDGYGNEYFYHASGIKKGRQIVIQGFESEDEVEFDLTDGEKGKFAVNLELIKEAPKKKPEKKEKVEKNNEQKKEKLAYKDKRPQGGDGVMAAAIDKAMKQKAEKEAAAEEKKEETPAEVPTETSETNEVQEEVVEATVTTEQAETPAE